MTFVGHWEAPPCEVHMGCMGAGLYQGEELHHYYTPLNGLCVFEASLVLYTMEIYLSDVERPQAPQGKAVLLRLAYNTGLC